MLKVINPSTEMLIEEIPTTDPSTMEQLFDRSKKAQKIWQQLDFSERAKVVLKFRDLLLEEIDACADILSAEMGKPVHHAKGEIKATAGRIDWFLENTQRLLQERKVHQAESLHESITCEPLGVIGNISAWNYPYFVGSNIFIPALLTGNSVLYKPSEYASMTGLKIGSLWRDAGLIQDVFQTVIGRGDLGHSLCSLPVSGMFFTGSQNTGVKISKKISEKLIPLGMELGGKDPAYICEDVDISRAAEVVGDGAFYNAGQSCCAVERIYVHTDIYEKFCQKLKEFVQNIEVGDPRDENVYMGPLARKEQLDFIDAQVQDALEKGAKYVVKGGRKPGKGYYYHPGILSHVNHNMRIMNEETFGPLACVQAVQNDAEAVRLMNSSCYGLTASVHTNDEERARKILHEIEAGTVYWNCCDRISPYLPWSGRKLSGLGSTLSEAGIRVFLQEKSWHMQGKA